MRDCREGFLWGERERERRAFTRARVVERYGLDPNAVDEDGWTALRRAAYHGCLNDVGWLAEEGW